MMILSDRQHAAVAVHTTVQLVGAARAGLPGPPGVPGRGQDPTLAATTKRMRQRGSGRGLPVLSYFGRLGVAATPYPAGSGHGAATRSTTCRLPSVRCGLDGRPAASLPGDRERRPAPSRRPGGRRCATSPSPGSPLPSSRSVGSPCRLPSAPAGDPRMAVLVPTLAGPSASSVSHSSPGGCTEIGEAGALRRLDVRRPRRAGAILLRCLARRVPGCARGPRRRTPADRRRAGPCSRDVLAAWYVVRRLQRAIRPEPLLDRPHL